MGMSASQARYLGLTARKNNNEYQAQQINQQRLLMANEMDAVATSYTNRMNNRQLLFVKIDPTANTTSTTRLTYQTITNTDINNGLGMRLVDASGKVVTPYPNQNYDEMVKKAEEEYQNSINNKAFYTTSIDKDGNSKKSLFSGENFLSSYFSGIGEDKMKTNPILDKDGNKIDPEDFKEKIKNLSASGFYDFWNENGYSFQNKNLLNNEEMYTADDAAAKAKYQAELARIEDMKGTSYLFDLNCLDPDYLETKLRNGEWFLEKRNNAQDDSGDWISASWQSTSSISDSLDKSDDAAAEAEYKQQSAFFQKKDKQLELQLKQLDTEHGALETELESIKKVVDKNVETSFKTFG